MKKIVIILLMASILASCTSALPGKFTRLADKVEAKGANFSEAQWEKTNETFEKLVDQYIDNYSSFKPSEKKEISKAIARYSAAAVKAGVQNASLEVNDILEDLPESIDGFMEGAKGFLEGLGL